MKRIKQELLDKDFVVNTPSEEKMHEVVGLLCDSKLSAYNFNIFGKETCIRYVLSHNDCYFGDREDYELDGYTILDYDDIWEHCGEVVEWRLKCNKVSQNNDHCFTVGKIYTLTENGLKTDRRIWKDFLNYTGDTPYDKWLNFVKEIEEVYGDILDFTLIGMVNSDNNIINEPYFATHHTIKFENGSTIYTKPININSVRGASSENIEKFMREYSGIFTGGNKMRENTKIENRIEELEKSIWENELKLEELKVANKYSDMSMEISSQLSLIDEEKKLLKGYETLDNMEIGNVIINNDTVIVISLYGTKAISKLSEGDTFNFLAGFFLCLTKLGSTIDTDWYDYSVHAALEDIELGNL